MLRIGFACASVTLSLTSTRTFPDATVVVLPGTNLNHASSSWMRIAFCASGARYGRVVAVGGALVRFASNVNEGTSEPSYQTFACFPTEFVASRSFATDFFHASGAS